MKPTVVGTCCVGLLANSLATVASFIIHNVDDLIDPRQHRPDNYIRQALAAPAAPART